MKKILFLALMACSAQVNAQLKNIDEFGKWSKLTYNQLEAILSKGYWKQMEQGQMDTLTYIRWIPIDMNEKNMGENVMAFVSKKNEPLNYLVYQTLNKETYQKLLADVKKSGYQFASTENRPDKKTDYYAKGTNGLSVILGKEKPGDPLMYIFGMRVFTNVESMNGPAPKQTKPAAVAKPISKPTPGIKVAPAKKK